MKIWSERTACELNNTKRNRALRAPKAIFNIFAQHSLIQTESQTNWQPEWWSFINGPYQNTTLVMEATFSSAPRLSSSMHKDEVVQTTLSTPQMASAELSGHRDTDKYVGMCTHQKSKW